MEHIKNILAAIMVMILIVSTIYLIFIVVSSLPAILITILATMFIIGWIVRVIGTRIVSYDK